MSAVDDPPDRRSNFNRVRDCTDEQDITETSKELLYRFVIVCWQRALALSTIDRETVVKLYRAVLAVGFAGGVALIVSAVLAPRFPISVIHAIFRDEPYEVAGLLMITPRLLLVLYGTLSSVLSAGLYVFSQAFLHSLDAGSAEMRDRTFTRFIVTASFAVGFLGARTLVTLSGIVGNPSAGLAGFLPIREMWVLGYHIHHFFFGLLFLVIVGWVAVFRGDYSKNRLAVLYGLGTGIFVDEIGMLLTGGEYFALSTYFLAVTFFSILLAGVYWDTSRWL